MYENSITLLKFNLGIDEAFKFQRYSGFAVQNFFFKILKGMSLKGAEKLHDEATIKPYSVSTLMRDENPVFYGGGPGNYYFKINILDSENLDAFSILQSMCGMYVDGRISLDNINFFLCNMEVKLVEYKQLLNGEVDDVFTLEFLSPTCFKGEVIYSKRVGGRGSKSIYEFRRKRGVAYQPIPNPNAMFRNLLRIWMKYSNIQIDREKFEDAIGNDQVYIYEFRDGIKTIWAREGSRKNQQGFIGSVTFKIDKNVDGDIRRIMAALIKLGEYSGTGIMRTAGLGQYKIVDGVK